jgi:hypothetical protein
MFKLASGDIVCNVDADNYTGKDFADFINNSFQEDHEIFLVADTKKRFYFLRNAFGRFCVKRKGYFEVGGLDEKMKGYGSETIDFYERLKLTGKREVIIENTGFLKSISHPDEERIANEYFFKSLKGFFIRYISLSESEVLFLFKDGTFENTLVIAENRDNHLPCAIKDGTLIKGRWISEEEHSIHLSCNGSTRCFREDKHDLIETGSNRRYHNINNVWFLTQIAKDYSFICNAQTHFVNKSKMIVKVNEGVCNSDIVYKNFIEELVVN